MERIIIRNEVIPMALMKTNKEETDVGNYLTLQFVDFYPRGKGMRNNHLLNLIEILPIKINESPSGWDFLSFFLNHPYHHLKILNCF